MMLRLIALFPLAAVGLLAQGQVSRSMYPWWDSPMVRDLHLSEEQSRQIKTIVSGQRSQLIDLRANVEKAEGDVEDLFNEDTVDQKRTADAVEKLIQARAELSRAYANLSLKLRGVLNTQQWRELQRRRPQPPNPPHPPQPGQAPRPAGPPREAAPGRPGVPPQPPQAPPPADEV
jgi:Spy/CpxP family protein refolding chaperone